MSYTNSITSKGQVTIPKEFRDQLGLDTIGKAQFNRNDRGEVVISRPKTPMEALDEIRAFLAKPGFTEVLSEHEMLVLSQIHD